MGLMSDLLIYTVLVFCLATIALGDTEKIDRSHPLGLDYRQPYGILTTKYQTPHVEWGKPLAGGPIKVLVMAPAWSQRETVELAERLDVRFTSWMCYGATRLVPAEVVLEQPFATREMVLGLLDRYLKEKYDVIIIGKLEWDIIPDEYRARLLESVKQGTGLVYVTPPQIDAELKQVFGSEPNNGREDIVHGVPLKGLPRLQNVDPERLVQTSTFGKGRVVLLDYQQPFLEPSRSDFRWDVDFDMHCLTPAWVQVSRFANNWPHEDVTPEMGAYDYYQSLVARAVRWAARGLSPIKLKAVIPEMIAAGKTSPISLIIQGKAPVALIDYAVGSASGQRLVEKRVSVSRNQPVTAKLPALSAGMYKLDLWACDSNKKVLEWSSREFQVKYSNNVDGVELVSQILEAGNKVRANVRISKILSNGQIFRAELWDFYGRCIDSQTFIPKGRDVKIELGPLAPLHIMHELRLFITEKKKDLVDYRYRFPVRIERGRDDFSSVVWANECSRNSFPTTYMLKKLQEVDEADAIMMVTGLLGRRPLDIEKRESGTVAQMCADANLMVIPNGGFGVGWSGGVEAAKDSHITEMPLNSPKRFEAVSAQAKRDAEFFTPYGPFFWDYASETVYSHDQDVDWHPEALARFRRLLKENLYDSLDALNREWGTHYASWDDVMPSEFSEAQKTGNYAPWVTHALSADVILAEYLHSTEGIIRGIDKGARAGLDADSGLYGANFGYDWWLLSKMTHMEQSYTSHTTYEIQPEIKRSFSKSDSSTIRGMWYGLYGLECYGRPSTVEYCRAHSWLSLFHSMNSDWWWTMGAPGAISGYAPDLTSLAPFEARSQELREIKSGIGKLFLSARRFDDAIAIHYSESSRVMDNLFRDKTDYSNCEYENSVGGFARALEDAGFQYRFVAYEEIEKGALQQRKYKALFLPRSVSVSDSETANIIEFVKNGGVVIADVIPGVYTKTGGRRSQPAFADLFPSDTPGTVTRYGRGYAVLTGEEMLKGYYQLHNNYDGWQAFGQRWEKVAELLSQYADLKPAISLTSKEGKIPPTEISRFDAGGIELIGMLRVPWLKDNGEYKARIKLPRISHLYDMRNGKYMGFTDHCDRAIDYQAQALAMSAYRVKSVDIQAPKTARAGEALRIGVSVMCDAGHVTGTHVLHMTVRGPDGGERKWYAQNVLAPKGIANLNIPFAINDARGRYTIRVRDCMSGITGQVNVRVVGNDK